MGTRIDGKKVAARTKADLAKRVELLKARGIQPGLGTILVGSDPGSVKYVAGKHADCAEIGVNSIKRELPENATFDQVADAVRQLHARGDIATPLPCTPRGVIELLRAYDIDLDGKEVCVLGRGITIGRTIGLLLTRKAVNATVTLCHTGTKDVREHMRRADVIVAAMGVAGFVKPEDIKEGSILVDVGVSRVFDEESGRYKVKGDVDKACYEKALAYTPNPGGVGPMTRAMLLQNVVEMAERQL
jgi:methylenetetrahydrofolate dehydrogenase (NADP+)/methenyltetrahydrofolate cyclohydrolase